MSLKGTTTTSLLEYPEDSDESSSSSEISSAPSDLFDSAPSTSIPVLCPPNSAPGTLVRVNSDNSDHPLPVGQTSHSNGSSRKRAKGNTASSSRYVAIPAGIQPGDQFFVPAPLTTGQVKEAIMKGTAPGYGKVELTLTRSLVMQEVHGIFMDPTPKKSACCKRVQCCAATSCMHPFCWCFGCSSTGVGREFLFKDGHSDQDEFLYLVKERSDSSGCCTLRRRCNPNHPFILEAYRVMPLEVEGILRPDVRRGPEFTVHRRGFCLLSGCACLRECKQRWEVIDRAMDIKTTNSSHTVTKAAANSGDAASIDVPPPSHAARGVIGVGFQQTCGNSPCYDCTPEAMLCCTPTVAVMRRDVVMTGKGWGSTDRVVGMLEGPCCCYGGLCCKKRARHWFFSSTQGKAYDVGALMMSDVSRHHVPPSMHHRLIGEPILLEFTKRNMSNTDKKLTVSAMLALKYMFLRDWEAGVVCCTCHCCGANFQC